MQHEERRVAPGSMGEEEPEPELEAPDDSAREAPSADAGSGGAALPSAWARVMRCTCLCLGIVAALGVHGLLQERIMSVPYKGELFRASAFLVLLNRVAATGFAVCMARVRGESMALSAPLRHYILVSCANSTAALCQYEALKWVSFPTQLLAKSFKMIPVMLWGLAMSGKRYRAFDWIVSLAVSGGVAEFMLGGRIAAPQARQRDCLWGLALLLLFLLADSFTSTFQEKLFREYKTTKYNQMIYVNVCSAGVALIMLASSGDALEALRFCAEHPRFLEDASAISIASVVGQFFIISMVKEFGALALAATMNVRQLLSILASYAIYAHPLTLTQSLGLVVVFAALFGKSIVAVFFPKPRRDAYQAVGKSPSEDAQATPSSGATPLSAIVASPSAAFAALWAQRESRHTKKPKSLPSDGSDGSTATLFGKSTEEGEEGECSGPLPTWDSAKSLELEIIHEDTTDASACKGKERT